MPSYRRWRMYVLAIKERTHTYVINFFQFDTYFSIVNQLASCIGTKDTIAISYTSLLLLLSIFAIYLWPSILLYWYKWDYHIWDDWREIPDDWWGEKTNIAICQPLAKPTCTESEGHSRRLTASPEKKKKKIHTDTHTSEQTNKQTNKHSSLMAREERRSRRSQKPNWVIYPMAIDIMLQVGRWGECGRPSVRPLCYNMCGPRKSLHQRGLIE